MLNANHSPFLPTSRTKLSLDVLCTLCRCRRKSTFEKDEGWVALIAERSQTKLYCDYDQPNQIRVIHIGDGNSRTRAFNQAMALKAMYQGPIWWEQPPFETTKLSRGCMLWTTGKSERGCCL